MNLHAIKNGQTPIEVTFDFMSAKFPHFDWEIEDDGMLRYWSGPRTTAPYKVEVSEYYNYWLDRARKWDTEGRSDAKNY